MFKNMKRLSAIFLTVLLGISTMTTVFAEGEVPEDKLLTEEIIESGKNAITKQSSGVKVKAGETATFTVSAEGMVRSYQWQVSKDGGKTWKKLSEKTDTLSIEAKAEYDGWLYRCAVTFKGLQVVYSEPVSLTIRTSPALTAETDAYLITVEYTDEAGIPDDTELSVSEIAYGSDEYWSYWNRSLAKLNENATKGSEIEESTYKGIASAVFFDISLISNGQEIEPEAPVQVEITMKNGGLPLFDGEGTKVIHFSESTTKGADGTELIDVAEVGKAGALGEGMPEGVAVDFFGYEQDSFSVVGLFTTDLYIDFEASEYVANLGDLNNLTAMLMAAGGVRAACDPTINAGKTVTDNDGDGIYELALSVNATSQQSSVTEATKSNIVMVIDVSGSMGNNQSWIYYKTYTYNSSDYNQYRYYTSSTNMNQRLYYRNGAWRTSNNDYGTVYNGTVYAYETRLHATQRAACAVVDALLAYNVNEDNITDMFEITLIKFAGTGETSVVSYGGTPIRDTNNGTLIKNGINNLTSNGGTNWQAALTLANTEANYFKTNDGADEVTSVIFLTDGFPTYYGTGSNSGSGQENNNNIATSYTNSRASARTIVRNGFTLYNIFAFGSDTTTYNNHTGFAYLRALTNYAYGSGDNDNFNETDVTRQYAFNSKSTDDLIAAFHAIINHITNNVGYAGVNLTDGVSLGATSTSIAVNGTAKADTMRYTVMDAADKLSYTVRIDKNGAATFTIYNADGTTTTLTDSAPSTVTTTINGTTITSQVYEVTVGSGDNAKTYKMSPATIDADTGMVQWNLAGLGILESGYTYTVAFDVWPNQLAYDIAADLNNGIYESVDEALDAYHVTDATERKRIKDAIIQNEDGSYSLYTNYEQGVEYYPATSQTDDDGNVTWTYGDKQTQPIDQPDPVPLKGSLLPMAKVWESDLSMSELNELLWKDGVVDGESLKYQITLHLWKADTREELEAMAGAPVSSTNQPYITVVLGWDEATGKYVFEKESAVAPGTMVNLDEAAELGFDITDTSKIKTFTNDAGTTFEYYMIEEGHYYLVTEEGSDLHFELESPLYHPMIVDGTLYNVYFGSGQTVEKMDPMYAVIATNYLKGGLNIRKEVSSTQIPNTYKKITVPEFENGKIVKDAGGNIVTREVDDINYTPVEDCEDEFAFKITIWKVDDNGDIQPVYTFDNQFKNDGSFEALSGSIGYREFGLDENGEDVTLGRNVIVFETTPNAAAKIAANKRGDNEPVYATLTSDNKTQIILRMPANGEIRLVNLPAGTQYTVEEIIDDSGAYNFAATKSEIRHGVDEEGEEVIEYVGVGSTNGVTGKVKGDTANLETFYNWAAYFYVYHSSTNKVEKISFADERVTGEFDAEKGKYTYTFNIVDETAENYLYGGYYQKYSGAKLTDAEIVAAEYTADANKKLWLEDTGATPYDAKKANIWKGTEAYTDTVGTTGGGTGTAMTPVGGIVYYLKEVPNGYIRPYIHFTYDDHDPQKTLQKLYVITASDDVNYDYVGYVLDPEAENAQGTASTTRSLAITIKKPDGTINATLTAKNVFDGKAYHGTTVEVTRGYLYLTDVTKDLLGDEFTYQPCWNTLDKVLVKGYTVRTVNGGTNYLEGDADCIDVTDVAAP